MNRHRIASPLSVSKSRVEKCICFKRVTLFIMIAVLLPVAAAGKPSAKWRHLKSDHIILSYNESTAYLAEEALTIAEETARTIINYFYLPVGKKHVSIALFGEHDFSNGSAYENEPLVRIYCRKTPWLFRNQNNWLKNVITHELSHIYTLWMMKTRYNIIAGISQDSPPNHHEGYVSAAIHTTPIPIWFVEGIAQIGSQMLKADSRDPMREMLLRDAYLNNRLLSLREMSLFEGTSREYELAYNQGYDFLLFLIRTYPDVIMERICKSIGRDGFSDAFEKNYYKKLSALYIDWKNDLAARYNQPGGNAVTKICYDRKGAYISEIKSADHGKYVIANWDHDYSRFDLFRVSPFNGKSKVISRDVGMELKKDDVTGTVYFSKEVFRSSLRAGNYDVYSISPEGKIKRETINKRCMTFDAHAGSLMYAFYDNGTTRIILRIPDGSEKSGYREKELISFDYKTAVFGISMMEGNSAILSLSSQDRQRIALLNEEGLANLWPDLDADTMEAVYAGLNQIIFVSTIDGTPQLYWCDLNEKNRWHKITDATSGVRFPSAEMYGSSKNIRYTEFKNGMYKIVSLDKELDQSNPIDISERIAEKENDGQADEEQNKKYKAAYTNMNIPLGRPYVLFYINRMESVMQTGEKATYYQAIPGIRYAVQNANETLNFGGIFYSTIPIGYEVGDSLYPWGTAWCSYIYKGIQISEQLAYNPSFLRYEDNDQNGIFIQEYYYTATSFDYELFNNSHLTFNYYYRIINQKINFKLKNPNYVYMESGSRTLEKEFSDIYNSHAAELEWNFISYKSKFDPAKIGFPGYGIEIKAGINLNKYPKADQIISPSDPYNIDNSIVQRYAVSAFKRMTNSGSNMSVALSLDVFHYLGGYRDGKIPLFMYDSYALGGENSFSGYAPDKKVRSLAGTALELRFNPFVDTSDRTRWYERLSIGGKIEAGYYRYFDTEFKVDKALSMEYALRYSMHILPDSLSSMYVKYARTIDEQPDTYRVYFGFTI